MARIRSVLVLALALPADAIEMPTVLSPGLVKRCAAVERTLAKIGKYERIVRVEKERGREAKAKSKKAEKRLTKLHKRRQKLARKGGTDAICAWIAEGEYTVEDARKSVIRIPQSGCTDRTACNYDANAVLDDASCVVGYVDSCGVLCGDGTSCPCATYCGSVDCGRIERPTTRNELRAIVFDGTQTNPKAVACCVDTSAVTNFDDLFDGFQTFDYERTFGGAYEFLCWDTSKVTMMGSTFKGKEFFNAELHWDTSRVRNMRGMFYDAKTFNQPLDWDTSKVTTMVDTFRYADGFNKQLSWDTSQVKQMSGTFRYARAFNQPLGWDTSSVTTMGGMFHSAIAFNAQLDWDTSKAAPPRGDMQSMFYNSGTSCVAFVNNDAYEACHDAFLNP